MVSRRGWSYRQQSPETIERFLLLASAQLSSTERTPGESVATGFSMNECLPLLTA